MCQTQERYSGDILAHLDSGVQEQELGKIFAIFPLLPPNSLEAACSCIRDVLTYFPSFSLISLNSRRWGEGARSYPGVQGLTPYDDTEHGWLLTPSSLTHRAGDWGHLLWHGLDVTTRIMTRLLHTLGALNLPSWSDHFQWILIDVNTQILKTRDLKNL